MNAGIITQDVIASLARRFGAARQLGKGSVFAFGDALICSVNYSKLLGGHKYFYAVPRQVLEPSTPLPECELGHFVLLICGSADRVLVLPLELVREMLEDVPTRRVDIFLEAGTYVMQTTKQRMGMKDRAQNAFMSECNGP
jgi:hypothetical protein